MRSYLAKAIPVTKLKIRQSAEIYPATFSATVGILAGKQHRNTIFDEETTSLLSKQQRIPVF